jgi:regulator of protease activity HflC (stomatin/prohibitin superfamily)
MIVGRESDEELPFILWSKTHAENEYKLVLGQGRELVSLDVVVNYRIKDPVAYLFGVQNPEDALRGLAYRVIMQETVGGNLDEVLSEKRATFSKTLQAALQAELDAHQIGIEVVDMPLRGIHPPIEVADAYQGVVSAQVEMVTLVTQARAEREKLVPRAEADRIKAISDAEAHAAVRLGEARGEAAQFRAVKEAYALSPGLYRERRRLETLEQAVQDKQLYVVDDRYGVSSECWVDMRPQPTTP